MGDFLERFASSLELFLNVLELLALFASAFTFFFLMFNEYSKALRKILAPCGLGFWARLRVLFICRKSVVKKRAFIEYAILKSQGHGTVASSWHTIINEFKAFYYEDQSNLVYSIPNCTLLIGADFSDAVSRYFDFIKTKKARKAFGIQEDRLQWVIKIHIEEAYATPTCLLTGLLSKYEENWEEFIKRYVSTAYITEAAENTSDSILASELYLTFAWLLWGPSYELNYRRYWAGLCQISYGDESNSIPAVADKDSDVVERLKDKFTENEEHRYGALISADVSLFEKKEYYQSVKDFANPDNSYFYDKIMNGELSFAAQINQFVPCTNYKSKKYYCTAYVWLLFEVESDDYAFKPEKSLAFFEHANLADRNTYSFLISTLIDKSLKHFQGIFGNPKLDGRKYRFVCALNHKIENACIARYNEISSQDSEFGRALRDRVIMTPKRTATSAFSAFDDFFTRNNVITYEEIEYADRKKITDLGRFYTDIYMECFPDDNERESFDHLLSYLKQSESSSDYKYHIVLAKDESENIVGGCIFNYYKDSNSGVIEFLAVKSDLQSGGIGSEIYKHVISVMEADAYKNRKSFLSCVFCEIDSPEYSKSGIKKYLYFWDKNGYKHLDFQYVQPPLSATQSPVYGLWLTVMPLRVQGKTIPGETVLSVLHDYLKYGMEIDDPEKNREYIQMKNEILKKERIALLNIL